MVKGLLQRGRAALGRAECDEPQLPAGSRRERELAARFAAAFGADDVDAVVALLTDDAWLAMPPAPHEYGGPKAIATFLRTSAAARDRPFTLVSVRCNRQPAFVSSLDGDPTGVLVVRLVPAGVAAITHFLAPRLARRVAGS